MREAGGGFGVKTRVLYFHHSDRRAGSPRSLAFLLAQMDREKYEPIVALPGRGPVYTLLRESGAEVLVDKRVSAFYGNNGHTNPISSMMLLGRNVIRTLPAYRAAKDIVRAVRPELVHLNDTSLFVAGMAARRVLKNVKVLVHARLPIPDSLSGRILRRMNHKYADAFVAIDHYGLSTLNAQGRISRVVYNFADPTVQRLARDGNTRRDVLRNEAHLGPEALIVLYLARISRGNGALELVRMARAFAAQRPECHFFIVGQDRGGIYTSLYQRAVLREAAGVPTIHVMGFRNDVLDLITSADVLVCPFTMPHSSRSIIEAATMGIPTVAADIPCVNELVVDGTTGLLYDPAIEDGFIRQMKRICDDVGLRHELGKGAAAYAGERFDAAANADRIFMVYEQLLCQ
jgi:glycosyltransferase involved in cell wall biosynthesis